jgi:hypothetical protein
MTKHKIWAQAILATCGVVVALGLYYVPTMTKSSETVMYSIEEAAPAPSEDTGSYEIQSVPTEPKLIAPTWGEILRSTAYQGIPYFLGLMQAVIGLITAKRLKKAKEKSDE